MKMIRLVLFLILALLINPSASYAQKVLRLDKTSSLKTKKFYIGDEITFQLKNDDDTWYTETILDILPEVNSIRFSNRVVEAGSIIKIRTFYNRPKGRAFERTLQVFGAAWALFALGGSLGGYELQTHDAVIPASSLLLGRIFYWIFKQKTYRIGRKYRILLLDLNPLPIETKPASP